MLGLSRQYIICVFLISQLLRLGLLLHSILYYFLNNCGFVLLLWLLVLEGLRLLHDFGHFDCLVDLFLLDVLYLLVVLVSVFLLFVVHHMVVPVHMHLLQVLLDVLHSF